MGDSYIASLVGAKGYVTARKKEDVMLTLDGLLTREEFKPGDKVRESGIYKVVHDTVHRTREHEVTCVCGEHFPPCHHRGGHVRFILVLAAHHLATHEHFTS